MGPEVRNCFAFFFRGRERRERERGEEKEKRQNKKLTSTFFFLFSQKTPKNKSKGGPRTAEEEQRLRDLEASFEYAGKEMCAADGMCQEKCPVKINTGELVKALRAEDMAARPRASAVAMVRVGAVWGAMGRQGWAGRGQALFAVLSGLLCRQARTSRPCTADLFGCVPARPTHRRWPTTLAPPPGPSTRCWARSTWRTACWAPRPSRPSPRRSTRPAGTSCPSGTPTCPRWVRGGTVCGTVCGTVYGGVGGG